MRQVHEDPNDWEWLQSGFRWGPVSISAISFHLREGFYLQLVTAIEQMTVRVTPSGQFRVTRAPIPRKRDPRLQRLNRVGRAQ